MSLIQLLIKSSWSQSHKVYFHLLSKKRVRSEDEGNVDEASSENQNESDSGEVQPDGQSDNETMMNQITPFPNDGASVTADNDS